MNHLRELLEAIPLNIGADDCWTPMELAALFNDTKECAESAMCFAIGRAEHVNTLSVIPELCRLPFKRCWFEAEFDVAEQPGRTLIGGLLAEEDDRGFSAAVFLRGHGYAGWSLEGTTDAAALSEQKFRIKADDHALQGIRAMTHAVRAFLSALHCSNVVRQEHTPDAKLQKARAKRGKAPLFSYWTLQLDGKSVRGENQGGSHASPRVHLRRGHPMRTAKGNWTWRQAHAVGHKSNGMVHKDYCAGSALVAATK